MKLRHSVLFSFLMVITWKFGNVLSRAALSNEELLRILIEDSKLDSSSENSPGNAHRPIYDIKTDNTYDVSTEEPAKVTSDEEFEQFTPRQMRPKRYRKPRYGIIRGGDFYRKRFKPVEIKTHISVNYKQPDSLYRYPVHADSDDLTVNFDDSSLRLVPAHHGIHVESGPNGHTIRVHPYDFGHRIEITKNDFEPSAYKSPNDLKIPPVPLFPPNNEYFDPEQPPPPFYKMPSDDNDGFLPFESIESTTRVVTVAPVPDAKESSIEEIEVTGDVKGRKLEDTEITTKLPPNVPIVNLDVEDELHSSTVSDGLEMIMPFEGSGEEDTISSEQPMSGRILDLFSSTNDTSPPCTTPKDEPGHCRRFRQCLLHDILNNFNLFLQYMCLVRGTVVGICCPDNPVVEIANTELSNITNSTVSDDIKQPPEGCGLDTKMRIVGGTISQPHEWTWMVALMRRNRFFCGGVIINNWYVLTAAHCVMGVNVKDITVRLGEYNFNIKNKHQRDISLSEIKRHAQFVTLTFQHDIALLKLKSKVQYSKFVGTVCLPSKEEYDGVNATVVGWGTVSFGGTASHILRQVTIPVWKNEDCDSTYLLENINESFMCAGSPENGEDACQGDSGGPLMVVNSRGRWEVIGIVSWGRRCGDPTYPGVYTRVSTYMDWIRKNSV